MPTIMEGGEEKEKGQEKEHEYRTHGHGQWGELTVGVVGGRVEVSSGENVRPL